MRSAHRVLCTLALSALLAGVCLLHSDTREGIDGVTQARANGGGKPADMSAPTDARVDIPPADGGAAHWRRGAPRRLPERLASRKGGAAGAGRSRAMAAPPRELRGRERRPAAPESRPPVSGADAPIDFDRVRVTPEAFSVAVTGVDWGAPRQLVLWRLEGETYARLAATRSREGGRFDFGQVVIPDRGLELVATALGAEPGPADWARSLELQPGEL